MADYREIPLTRGRVAIVDAEDYEMLMARKWHLNVMPGGRCYATTRSGECKLRMHRVIMGAVAGMQVDHRNHDTLDNRKMNLRVCTNSQNSMNQLKSRDNTSGYKGVYLCKRTGKWRASITVQYKVKRLGRFATPEDASAAYRAAALNLHGEFACV